MEVHHHPHVEKKSFKEYLLEGLMIFLAVSMGFIAENIREYISEKKIEKEYIRSFVADIKSDIAGFQYTIPREEAHIKGLDTLLNTLTHPPYNDSTLRLLYYLYRKHLLSIDPMLYTLRTITQLKNSGGLRLISDQKASDSIVYYNRLADDANQTLNYATHDFMIPTIQKGSAIFNGKYFIPYDGETIDKILHTTETIKLLNINETVLAEYTGLIYQVKQIRLNYLSELKWHQQRALDMLVFFQKEYNLKEE